MHFQIHNGSRDVSTRNVRAQNAKHGGLKQFILNGTRRLIRGRPIVVTEEVLKQNIEELRKSEKEGILFVTTMDAKKVDLYAEGFPLTAVVPEVNPRPNPPLDSASNDEKSGVQMNPHGGEAPPPKEFTMPVEPPIAATENPVNAELPVPPNVATIEPPVEPPVDEEPAQDPMELADLGAPEPQVVVDAPATDLAVTGEEPAVEVTHAQEQASEEAAAGTEQVVPETTPEQPATEAPKAEEKKAPTPKTSSSRRGR